MTHQPDNWGWRTRNGMFIVGNEAVPEAEWWAMAPPGVSIHAARVTARWRGRETKLLQDAAAIESYAEARSKGDFRTAAVIAGEGVDLVHDIPKAGEVVRRMAADAEARLVGTNSYSVRPS